MKKGQGAGGLQASTRNRQASSRLRPPSPRRRPSEAVPTTNNGEAVHRVGSTYKPVNKRKRSTDRTTRLLIVLLVLFLLTEFPQVF